MAFELPPLPYDFDALEPYIDARTVEIHYTKHHATYLSNLNKAIAPYPELAEKPIDLMMKDLDALPEEIRTVVRGNGGGYFNHNLYWANMKPGGSEPQGSIAQSITDYYGDLATFKAEMEKTGLGRLGSGYAWLSQKADKSLVIHNTLNQDTPLAEGLTPLLVVDVWEHAYYLKYQNRRAEYLSNWWHLVNWDIVERRFAANK